MKTTYCALWLFACVITGSAQYQYLDVNQKRADLVSSLRILGPLNAPDWLSTLPLVAGNYGAVYSDFTYHYVGNYGYVYLGPDPSGQYAYFYDYRYRSAGVWVGSDDVYLNNTAAAFNGDFGLFTPTIPPSGSVNYSFTLSSGSYNVAGLRYESVFVVNGRSGNNALGWIVNRGQSSGNTGLPFNTAQTFDLAQNVEIPSFKISDYWYGPYYNYPQSAKAPTPQNTIRQTQPALIVGTPLNRTTNVVWVEEGVYRPGLVLQPGYSVPRLTTFMEQYFESAWKCDPASGQPPRLSTTNWNGIGKINTNAATPSGLLAAQGYYFTPTEPGKVILKTQPQENGFYGEVPFYALQMFVDKNRDGLLTTNDVTTTANPHVFWVNNDCDRAINTDLNLWDELDVEASLVQTNDSAFVINNFRVPTLRDLEDYDRLHIKGLKELCRDLPTGQAYTVTMRWKSIQSGNPAIFVFNATDSDGARGYLTNSTLANAQISPTTYPPSGSPGISPLAAGRVESNLSPILHNDNYRCTNDYFIYCGTSRGAGELAVSVYKNGVLLSETSVFLDLRDVKELYERWTLGDTKGGEPAITSSLFAGGLPTGVSATYFASSPANSPYILLVHGWNVTPDSKDIWSDTGFKRLYWQGYTGRFGALRWPTDYGFGETSFSFTDIDNYNRSEFVAWKSGEGLRNLLTNANSRFPGKVYLVSHSQGAVVAGEALALHAEKYQGGQIVNRYVASQAAVALSCYATNNDSIYQTPFQYVHPWLDLLKTVPLASVWLFLKDPLAPNEFDSHTADVYPGWLETNRVSCGARINFYNIHDFATATPLWGFNQMIKPQILPTSDYSYVRIGNGGTSVPSVGGSSSTLPSVTLPVRARQGITPPTFRQLSGYFRYREGVFFLSVTNLDWEYNLKDMYQVMSFASEARTFSLGASAAQNALEQQVDLTTVWPADVDPIGIFSLYGRHKWHSAQFRSNFIQQGNYWSTLLGLRGFQITQAP